MKQTASMLRYCGQDPEFLYKFVYASGEPEAFLEKLNVWLKENEVKLDPEQCEIWTSDYPYKLSYTFVAEELDPEKAHKAFLEMDSVLVLD